jgi:hypothetical protein
MISLSDMFEDRRSDEVGQAIRALRAPAAWTAEKFARAKSLNQALQNANYKMFEGHLHRYYMRGGMGFSYVYQVPFTKRGQLQVFRGKLIRLVCVGNQNFQAFFMASVVNWDQRGLGYEIAMVANDCDAPMHIKPLWKTFE